MFFVDKETRNKRLEICKSCKYFKAETSTCGTPLVGNEVTYKKKKQKLCGCHMPTKTRLKAMSCPLMKWTPFFSQQEMDELHDLVYQLGRGKITKDENQRMTDFYNKISGERKKPSTCRPCINEMISRLRIFLNDAGTTVDAYEKPSRK